MKNLYITILLMVSAFGLRAQSLYFPPLAGSAWETLPASQLGWCPDRIDSMYVFLEQTNTKAFLVLKDGKIVLEKYFGTFTQDSAWYWASAGKTITSLLVGIAQEEGSLNIQHSSSDYLGAGWSSLTPGQESAIKVWHHLTMTTGLNDDVPDLDCTLPPCLTYLAAPGTRWSYHNAPYTLLDSIIRSATGQTLNSYTNTRLKNKTGMTGLWVKVGYNNVYFSTARSMARFGILIQNEAVWNGQTVLGDTAYFNQMITTSQNINQAYGYLWWLNGTSTYILPYLQTPLPGPAMPDAPSDMVAALGKNGQILNVSESTGFVVVRMGNLPTQNVFVPNVYNNQIWQHINQLSCGNAVVGNVSEKFAGVVFPNPVGDNLSLISTHPFSSDAIVTIHNKSGLMVLRIKYSEGIIDVSGLSSGVYNLVIYEGGKAVAARFIKK